MSLVVKGLSQGLGKTLMCPEGLSKVRELADTWLLDTGTQRPEMSSPSE